MKQQLYISRRDFLEAGAVTLAAAGIMPSPGFAADQGSKGGQWKIGCYTRPWDGYDYKTAFDEIARAGYRYLGLMTTKSSSGLVISVATTVEEAKVIGAEAEKRGLDIISVYGGDIAVGKSLQAGIDDLRRLIDNCAACGAENLLLGGTDKKERFEDYFKAVAECCDYAAEKGICMSVKPHGGLNATGAQCRDTVEKIGHKNFRIWYDPGNIFYYSDAGLDPAEDVASVDGLVVGACIKDYIYPKNVMVTPGAGMVDFEKVLARLKQGGFQGGPLIVECLKRGSLEELRAEAVKARCFLEDLTGMNGSAENGSSITLFAGTAAEDITPPQGYRMSGYFSERLNMGVTDPLKAKAVVFRQGSRKAVMVFCDIIGISSDVSKRAREQIKQKLGIQPSNVLISATHSHTGPLYAGALRKHFHDKAVAEHGSDPCENEDYPSKLVDAIVNAVMNAAAGGRAARLKVGSVEQSGLSFNRRFHMKDGTVRFNPGSLNPDIVKAAGPIDPEVGIVMLCNEDSDKPFAGLVNFALHLDTVGGTMYSADYPSSIETVLQEEYGKDFLLMFGIGTCGDINHIDVTTKDRLKTDHIGTTLGRTVIQGVPSLIKVSNPALASRHEAVKVPMQEFTSEEISMARENINKVGTSELSFMEQVRAYKTLDCHLRGGREIDLEVQVFKLGSDLAVVGLPGEVFVDLGLEIKRLSPFAKTLVVELCHDAPGYIPTGKAFKEGSYETVNSRIAPGGGETMVQTAVKLLNAIAKQ